MTSEETDEKVRQLTLIADKERELEDAQENYQQITAWIEQQRTFQPLQGLESLFLAREKSYFLHQKLSLLYVLTPDRKHQSNKPLTY